MEIPATDPWLWVRADTGLLDRRERGLHFSSHELLIAHFLPRWGSATEDSDLVWTTLRGKTLIGNNISPFSDYSSEILRGILRNGKA